MQFNFQNNFWIEIFEMSPLIAWQIFHVEVKSVSVNELGPYSQTTI